MENSDHRFKHHGFKIIFYVRFGKDFAIENKTWTRYIWIQIFFSN